MNAPTPQLSPQVRAKLTYEQNINERYGISPHCSAPRHNMVKAARGDGGLPRCICPYAVELLKAHRARRREHYKDTRGKGQDRPGRIAVPPSSIRIRDTPDMTTLADGACKTFEGMVLMDDYLDAPGNQKALDRARAVCVKLCDVLDECTAWVRAAEQPAGSWQGMIAGLTRRERAMMKRVRTSSDATATPPQH